MGVHTLILNLAAEIAPVHCRNPYIVVYGDFDVKVSNLNEITDAHSGLCCTAGLYKPCDGVNLGR